MIWLVPLKERGSEGVLHPSWPIAARGTKKERRESLNESEAWLLISSAVGFDPPANTEATKNSFQGGTLNLQSFLASFARERSCTMEIKPSPPVGTCFWLFETTMTRSQPRNCDNTNKPAVIESMKAHLLEVKCDQYAFKAIKQVRALRAEIDGFALAHPR